MKLKLLYIIDGVHEHENEALFCTSEEQSDAEEETTVANEQRIQEALENLPSAYV